MNKTKNKQSLITITVALSSILVTFFLQIIISNLSDTNPYLYKLFFPKGDWYQNIVPFAILFMFVYVLLDVLMKWVFLFKDSGELKNNQLSGNAIQSSKISENIKNIFRQLQSTLETEKNSQKAHEIFRHLTDIATDNATSRYSISRIFIWAMPILGFIGTVMGISMAVENFSGFLTGDIEKIDAVKMELSNVSMGLAYAFDTTLLGLSTSLVAMLLISFVQSQEEDLLTSIEHKGLEIITNHSNGGSVFTNTAPSGDSPSDEMIENARKINEYLSTLSNTMHEVHRKFEDSVDKLNQISERAGTIPQKFNDLNEYSHKINDSLSNSLEGLSSSASRFVTEVASLQESQKISTATIAAVEEQNKLISNLQSGQKRLAEVLESLTGPLEFKIVSSNKNQ